MDYPAFIGGSYRSQSFTADQERTVNWYEEVMEVPGPTTKRALYPTPGVEQLSSVSQSPGRAHYANAGREFAVIGATFYELDEDGGMTSRGTVSSDSFPATISNNGAGQLFITSGGNGYVFTLGTNVLAAVAALASKARMGAMLDGYCLALDTITSSTTPTVYISDLSDAATWDPTRFIQRSAQPDPWVSMFVTANRYLYLLGEQTSEVWYDAGSSPIPFALHPSGLIPYGIAAAFSVAGGDGSLVWLARTGQGVGAVVQASGFSPQVISTFPIQNAITGFSTISDAQADVYSEAGHTFYVLSFTSEQQTFAFDYQTQRWHDRGTWISEEGRFRVWRPRWHAYAFGQHRWLDAETGSLYRSSIDISTDVDSRPLRRVRRAPAMVQENKRIAYASFELDLERGQGLTSGQGSDPQVMLRYSDDNGETWGNEHYRSAGKLGEYSKRVRFERCGQARRRVFEVSVSDPIAWRLTGAYLDVHLPAGMSAPSQGEA
jgi:hypothetical protein